MHVVSYHSKLRDFREDLLMKKMAISVVEINTAIICSCMPACASFSKHVLEHSRFITSLRSAFSRYSLSSSKALSTEPKLSDAPSSTSRTEYHQRLVSDLRPHFNGSNYIELQEPHTQGWVGGTYSADASKDPQSNHTGPSSLEGNGITKTVAVNIV